MDIHEVLEKDVIRLFNGASPLKFIEDVRIFEDAGKQMCDIICRMPSLMETFYDRRLYDICCPGNWNTPGVPKAPEAPKPEKKIDPMDAISYLTPVKIIYSGPKTIVFWPDGTKTIVSRMEGQENDEYGAFCAAVVKKMFGATHKAKKFLKTVSVHQESNPRKPKPEETCEVPVKPWEEVETIPMPGTEDPNWGQKHWMPETLEEDNCNG